MEMKEVGDFLASVAGGGAAGYLDQKYATKVAGLTVGTMVGLSIAGLGMTKYAGSMKSKCLAAGEGMLAGEAYRMVANRVTPGSVVLPVAPATTAVTTTTPAATAGVRGVRGSVGALPLPSSGYSTRDQLLGSLQNLQAQVAARQNRG